MYWCEMSYYKYKILKQFDRMHFEFEEEYDYFDIDEKIIDCDLIMSQYDNDMIEVE